MAKHESKTPPRLTLFGEGDIPEERNSVNGPHEGTEKGEGVTATSTELREPSRAKDSGSDNLALLYDLFFAANLTAFSGIHETTTLERLVAYIGYFCILWFLWLTVTLYDARFLADSVTERLLRAVHLGAMVGVSVVAPQYDPAQQVKGTFQAFSIILMVSRVALAAQYAIAAITRCRTKSARLGMIIMSGAHLAAAAVYLGITFRFSDSTNSRVFVAWYIIAFCETVVILAVSSKIKGINFERKDLPGRMKTATLLILGEGVIVVADNVATIVKNVNSWTSATIGVLTATVAIIYIVFLIYADWSWIQPKYSQLRLHLWCLLHFPFHLALVLLMEGATQFVIWWKIVEIINFCTDAFNNALDVALSHPPDLSSVTENLVGTLNATVWEIWSLYPPTYVISLTDVQTGLDKIHKIPNSFWASTSPDDATIKDIVQNIYMVQLTVVNSLFVNFKIDSIEGSKYNGDSTEFENQALQNSADRFNLVYIYVFCVAGATLILMAVFNLISAFKAPKTWFEKAVTAVNLTLGVGLMLLATMSKYDARAKFATTPWIIPSMCLVYFVALVLIHLARPPSKARES